jgi:hypothetical protein
LNHYIIQNMASVEKPTDGIRNFTFQHCLSYFLDANSIALLHTLNYAWVRSKKCAWALTTDDLMKNTDLHIFILGLNILST